MDLFGTAGIRGDVRERVTPALALSVGRAVALHAAEPGVSTPTFVVGRDGRETGSALADAVAAGLQSGGARSVRVGRVPTPGLAYASRGCRGVMVTASHNPPTDNGLKLFRDGQEYDREAERAIEESVETLEPPVAWDQFSTSEEASILKDYREAVIAYASGYGGAPDDLTVAVDCGTGMGGRVTPQILRALGAEVVALNAQVDGHFPARESKPTAESLAELRAFVRDGDADLGIGHDGDADRIAVVDADGEVVHEDTVVAVIAERFVAASDATDPVVVTTPNASARIDDRVRAVGGRVERVRLGALHEGIAAVRARGDEGTEVAFAAEPWKHIHPKQGPWIDGVASAAVLVRLVAADSLDALRAAVTERPYRKVSVPCPDARKAQVMEIVADALPDAFPNAAVDTEYGVRVEREDASWVLVRPSGTEPYVRVYAEADDVDALVKRARDIVEAAL
jgi:phosphomannomutase